MPISGTDADNVVVRMVQLLLHAPGNAGAITPAAISGMIDFTLDKHPELGTGISRQYVEDELTRRFSLWVGKDTVLTSDTGHQPWLNSQRQRGGRYWTRYEEWLEAKLSFKITDSISNSTTEILGLLEDPLRDGPWDRRGLVVGHVQSGKTAHYTGLICKAADAGYKIIIVLAGLHNNLRSQTQMRLDEGFLGYETNPNPTATRTIGVGKIDDDAAIRPNFVTNRTDRGDFTNAIARNLGISPEQRPWLFVVKKNKTVLTHLLRWIRNHAADYSDPASDRRVVTTLPLLMIDDEADHASVDTGEQLFDANGRPDEEHQPTAINGLVRDVIHSFSRSAYVGYTATPFANIFIHEKGETLAQGPDLFPSAFIINLAAPSDYIGPSKIFGQAGEDGRDGDIDLIRHIDDHSDGSGQVGWMPVSHRKEHRPQFSQENALPPSLVEAINAFLLACTVRHLRGQENEHASMLVHVTRFTAVQAHVHSQVKDHLVRLRQKLTRKIGHEPILDALRALWERDFLTTTQNIRKIYSDLVPEAAPSWCDIASTLSVIISDIGVNMINGTAKDALDYSVHEGVGVKVIAIGGDKLSRGMTLEGLCVSYFLRASRMYDTLMQMGRWFGYRTNYLDLCRLYTTPDLAEWFGHITDAAEELRAEFDIMANTGATPREYGLKVQSHPVLMVTSRLKMRSARNLLVSFSGQLLETVSLHRSNAILARNLSAAQGLVSSIGQPEVNPERARGNNRHKWTGSFLWNAVPAVQVTEFLSSYETHPSAYKVNSPMLSEFIQSMTADGELTSWTVAVIGVRRGRPFSLRDDISVGMIQRRMKGLREEQQFSIGRLLSPRDESIDLSEDAWKSALLLTQTTWRADPGRREDRTPPDVPNGPAIRRIRGFGAPGVLPSPERGLLLLYGLDPRMTNGDFPEDAPPIIAFGISFPSSHSGTKVEYMCNNVEWESEYGSAE